MQYRLDAVDEDEDLDEEIEFDDEDLDEGFFGDDDEDDED